ncbi:MAG TPA: TetR/AcrR family transcriptional regulator [Streptosporangiaceae bacterium]|nr:TetR/AcrR family transcriptional regulator [Streptosporangiaceae bacterium]
MPTTSESNGGTPARILDAAERIVQVRGFNAFSYGDIADELRITTAALHYHFPRKAELGKALIARYSARFGQRLRALDAQGGAARAKLDGYVALYADVLRQGRMCMCGVLAAEIGTLSAGMQDAVRGFFDQNESWLARVLEEGSAEGSMRLPGPVTDAARMIIAGLEGAMLLAMTYDDVERFTTVAGELLASLYRS